MIQTKKIALGGVSSALALVILLIGGAIGIGAYAAPMLAGLILLPAGRLLGAKMHALLWLAVSLLALLLVPDAETALMFLAPFGCYPIVRPWLCRLPGLLGFGAKLLFFNAVTISLQLLLMLLLVPQALELWLLLLLLLGNAVFLLYDRVLPIAEQYLVRRLSKLMRM